MMKRLTGVAVRFILCVGMAYVTLRPARAQAPMINFGELERVIQQELKETETPGIALAVVKGEQVVFAKSYGVSNVETGAPLTTQMLFRTGTITKIFTGAALVSLAEEGLIELDQPVGKYIKGLSPKLARITAHQLLTHTSGLREEHQQYGLHDYALLRQTVQSWKDDYCLFEPGRIYSHSNPGYVLAGLLIQEVSGKPFTDVLDARLFKPLGMLRTTFHPTVVMTYPFTQSYRAFGEEKLRLVRPYALDAVGWPSGSMFSNVDDLTRFAIAFLDQGKLEGKQILSPTLAAKISAPDASVPSSSSDQRSGYGVTVESYRGVRVLRNSGSWGGFTTLLLIAPEQRVAVILLVNRNAAFFNSTTEKALELMLPLQTAKQRTPQPQMSISQAELQDYPGTYANENVVEILLKGGRLWLKENGTELPISKMGENLFSAAAPGSSFSQEFFLVKGSGGKVEYLHRAGRALKKL